MSYLYFQSGDTQFVLDSYASVSAPLAGQLSESPMQDGTTQSDNYTVGTPKVSISGIITDVKTARSRDLKSTGNWVDSVYSIINNKQSVLLQYRVDVEPTAGWFITSFTPSQDLENGVGGKRPDESYIQSFKISIEFTKPILAKGLTSTVQPPDAYLDATQAKGSKNVTTSNISDETTKGKVEKEKAQENAARAWESIKMRAGRIVEN